MSIKPITPQEVTCNNIPNFVINTVNKLITNSWNGKCSIVTLHDLIYNLLKAYNNGEPLSKEEISLVKNWLCIEDIYRDAGWKVVCYQSYHTKGISIYFKFEK